MTKEKKKDYFALIVGLMAIFKFRVFGTFYGSEIIAYASYFFINWTSFKNNKKVVTLMNMSFIWLAGVLIADMVNDTPSVDALKGAFNVIFLIALIPFVYWMMADKPRRWMWFAAGYATAILLSYFMGGGIEKAEGSLEDMLIWRVYFYYHAALVVCGIIYFKGYHKISYLFIELFGIWSLSFASRNIFLAQTIAVVVLYYIDTIRGNNLQYSIINYKRKIVGLIFALGVGAFIASSTYEYMASTGMLGDKVYAKYMMQKYAKGGLASGRSDAFVSLCIISDNPLIGYGSYAKDTKGLVNKYAAKYELEQSSTPDEMLPGHSHILGAWVYAGLLGAIYWFYILIYLAKMFKSGILMADRKMLGFRMFFTMMNLWNIMFSPFQGRMNVLLLVINLMILEKLYKENKIIES